MNWLRMPAAAEFIVIAVGVVFLLATIWEWRKGYRFAEGHFDTPLYWKSSLAIRFVFSGMLILISFITAEQSATINRDLFCRGGFALMITIMIVSLVLGVIRRR